MHCFHCPCNRGIICVANCRAEAFFDLPTVYAGEWWFGRGSCHPSMPAEELDPSHHIFRYVGGASIDGDFIEPAALRRKVEGGRTEEGLSVNWVEYFRKSTSGEAVQPLVQIFARKKFKVGKTSKFALLNVANAKKVASVYATVAIVLDPQQDDPSHSLVKDYDETLNDQVAEQLAKAIIRTYPVNP